MPTRKARVVQESVASGRSILSPPGAPAAVGRGQLDILCGACGTVLIARAQPSLPIHNIVIRCPICRQCNDTG
jgi:hypothetical protein